VLFDEEGVAHELADDPVEQHQISDRSGELLTSLVFAAGRSRELISQLAQLQTPALCKKQHPFEHKPADQRSAPRRNKPMNEIDRYETSDGDTITLESDGAHWQVSRRTAEGSIIWTETSVNGVQPFNEEEARSEFERWRT
jgi:hypothetical protein